MTALPAWRQRLAAVAVLMPHSFSVRLEPDDACWIRAPAAVMAVHESNFHAPCCEACGKEWGKTVPTAESDPFVMVLSKLHGQIFGAGGGIVNFREKERGEGGFSPRFARFTRDHYPTRTRLQSQLTKPYTTPAPDAPTLALLYKLLWCCQRPAKPQRAAASCLSITAISVSIQSISINKSIN